MKNIIAIAAIAGLASAASAQVTAGLVADPAGNDIFVSQSSTAGPGVFADGLITTWSPGDMFGIADRGVGGPGLPFAMADDSVSIFTTDTQGIIGETDFGRFFGAVDTENGANSGPISASWTFDISGLTGLNATGLFAAMGDFEASSDFYDFTYSIDGAPAQPLFTSAIDEAGTQNYLMDNGTPVALDDPALLNGNLLTNDFQSLSAPIAGSGSTLELTFTAETNGGSEAFAFRSLEVTGIPTPGALALAGVAGLAAGRRRRA